LVTSIFPDSSYSKYRWYLITLIINRWEGDKDKKSRLGRGHKSSKTTGIYNHVSDRDIGKIKSPLDSLRIRGGDDAWRWRSSIRGMYMRTMFGYIMLSAISPILLYGVQNEEFE
jgi:hypothetical protein